MANAALATESQGTNSWNICCVLARSPILLQLEEETSQRRLAHCRGMGNESRDPKARGGVHGLRAKKACHFQVLVSLCFGFGSHEPKQKALGILRHGVSGAAGFTLVVYARTQEMVILASVCSS